MADLFRKQRVLKGLLVVLFWTLIGLSFASQFYLSSSKAGRPVSWGQAVSWSLGDWYVWALLSIPIMRLARQFPLEGGLWLRTLPLHLIASACFSLGYMVVRALVGEWQSRWSGEAASFSAVFHPLVVKTFHFNVLIYWVILSVSHAGYYYRQFQERELRASELESHLTKARLHSLQMQLNPHFLFNTLHAISALMHKDVNSADRMLNRLSDLLRMALENTEAHEVPLRQEIDFLKRYLEIEQTRFGDRLKVRLDVSPETMEAMVPNLLLQPLVENAIQHGVEPYSKPGEVALTARRQGERLLLEVRDNGGGLKEGWREGVGLSNVQARLGQLYPGRHQFEMANHQSGGLSVRTVIPFRPAHAGPS